jgi:hypothetical protein
MPHGKSISVAMCTYNGANSPWCKSEIIKRVDEGGCK